MSLRRVLSSFAAAACLVAAGLSVGADRTITWVGSHNFSYNSLRQSDETLLQLEDSTVFSAFRTNFRTVRDTPGIRSVANGGTATCS